MAVLCIALKLGHLATKVEPGRKCPHRRISKPNGACATLPPRNNPHIPQYCTFTITVETQASFGPRTRALLNYLHQVTASPQVNHHTRNTTTHQTNQWDAQQLVAGSLPPIASRSTRSKPKGTDLVRAMKETCAGSAVRRSLQGGGEASLSSLPSAAALSASCCHLRRCCSRRTAPAAHGLGGSIAPAVAAGKSAPACAAAVLACPAQLSLGRLLSVLVRV
jgi:hypothetical protein